MEPKLIFRSIKSIDERRLNDPLRYGRIVSSGGNGLNP
jgi:hypothetical protein